MDNMDVDQIVDVPDTPDRLTSRVQFDMGGLKEENHSGSIHSRNFFEEVYPGRPNDVENRRKRTIMRRANGTSSSSNLVNPKKNKEAIERHSSRNDVIDLSERSMRRPVVIDNQSEIRKKPVLANGASGSRSTNVIPDLLGRGNEGASSESGVGSAVGNGEGLLSFGRFQAKPANNNVVHLDSTPSPILNRQKRLVRNGCISPNNIAKAKQLPLKEENASVAVVQNTNASTGSRAPSVSIDVMDLVAEGDNSRKGKGKAVLCQPSPPKELNAKNKHSVSRSSKSWLGVTSDCARDVSRVMEESSGWRSTRNRHRQTNLSISVEDGVVIEGANDPNCAGQQLHDGKGRSDQGTSCDPPSQSSRQSSSPSARLRQLISHQTTSTHPVRPKLRYASSSFNECSTSAHNDPEVVLIASPVEPSTSRLTSRRANISKRVIEVERSTPELRHNGVAEEVRMRQLEADERLARELQEQLYNEAPAFEAREYDEHIGMTLQQQGDLARRSSRSTRQGGSSLISDLRRESQLRRPNSIHRAFQSRASNAGRTARTRSRFPGVARALMSSTGRAPVFPADMDIDTRMQILGTMEAFSDMGVDPGILQIQRDFNENDYEMLLALDDRNDRHGGASFHVINGLPESTVQSDSYDEACAVCLETPTIGDTIRHLPCLHKFHKDCIDPWLRRKPSCPVCKSSIT